VRRLRRFVLLAALVAAAALAALYVVETKPGWYIRLVYPLRYQAIVAGHAREVGVDGALLAAVIYQESKFNVDARSRAGALGLMQLLPSTAEAIALRTGGTRFTVSDLLDPEINIRYGAWYLRDLLDKYRDERLALAAYNAGQTNVDRWLAAGSGIRYPETRAYVDRVEELKVLYRRGYGVRLGPPRPG